MTREEKIKVFEMRLDGYTLQRIANDMGVTRQRIYQILYERPRRGFKSIYPLLNGWMNDNKETYVSLALSLIHISENAGKVSCRQCCNGW